MRGTLEERFWDKVQKGKDDECWLWTANKLKKKDGSKGYGLIGKGRRGEGVLYAHRVSYEIHYGPIPKGLYVLHRCDNPQCVNPAHLFVGTHQDNMDDMDQKGRRGKTGPRAGTGAKSKLTAAQVQSILTSNLSQTKLAKKYGVGQSTISRILRGKSCQNLVK